MNIKNIIAAACGAATVAICYSRIKSAFDRRAEIDKEFVEQMKKLDEERRESKLRFEKEMEEIEDRHQKKMADLEAAHQKRMDELKKEREDTLNKIENMDSEEIKNESVLDWWSRTSGRPSTDLFNNFK